MTDTPTTDGRPTFDEPAPDGMSAQTAQKVLGELGRLAGYKPRVAIFGKTGAGKSSLSNAIFGKDVSPVSHVRSGTREPIKHSDMWLGGEIELIDFPGVGENPERDAKYLPLYRSYVGNCDIIFWLIKADDRAFTTDINSFSEVIKASDFPLDRVIFIVSQCDKVDPYREWNTVEGEPSATQKLNILDKSRQIADMFGVSEASVVPIAAEFRFGFMALVERIIAVCPGQSALGFWRSVQPEFRSEDTQKGLIRRLIDVVMKTVQDNVTPELVGRLIGSALRAFFRR